MKSLLYAAVAAFILFAGQAAAQSENRVSKTWEVRSYDLSATVPGAPADRQVGISANLEVRNVSAGSVSTLSLRLSPAADVSEVKINGNRVEFTRNEEKWGSGSLQRIVVRGFSAPAGGTVKAEMAYKLRVEENSGVASLNPLGAHFLPLGFWYPTPNSWYFPRGADFAPFRLTVNAPGMTVVSSGAAGANGVFEQKLSGQPFFVAGSWDTVPAGGVRVFVPKGLGAEAQPVASELAAVAAEARTFFEKLLGPAELPAINLVAVRRGAGFGDGGTVLVDENVFRRKKLDSLTVMSVAESIARIWLGNVSQVSGDGYGVIREGMARYYATGFIESRYGKEIADLERMRQRAAYATVIKRDAPLSQVTPLDDYYFSTNANKGAMVWRLLARRVGENEFHGIVRANLRAGALDLAKLRGAFPAQKDLLDFLLDQVTDTDLMIGLPQAGNGETRSALRNAGAIDADVDVVGYTGAGERIVVRTTIPARGFGEVVFKTAGKVVGVEVDAEKLYPQTDYANDAKPVEIDESDRLLFVKRAFDKQDFPLAEKNARTVLRLSPRFDDVRVLLARSLAAQGRTAEAEREFRAVFEERLPSARGLAWASVGLGEIALKAGQTSAALGHFNDAIRANAELGASFAARQAKGKLNPGPVDPTVAAFFAEFDKAAVSNSKATLEALLMPGDLPKIFSSGIAGQAQEWTTRVLAVDVLDASQVLAEVSLATRIIGKNPESGPAVFRLVRSGGAWKLSGVEIFEVR